MKNEQKQDCTPVSDMTNASVQHDKHQCLRQCTPVFNTIDSSVCQSPAQSTKKCHCCQQELPLSAFYMRDKQNNLDSYCKECRKTANRKKRKSDAMLPEKEAPLHLYPVITNIKQRDIRLTFILHALQTVHESMDRKRQKLCESEYFN